MKIFIRISLWLALMYHGFLCIVPLVISWGPLYLMITERRQYDWSTFFSIILADLLNFIVALLLYRNFFIHKKPLSSQEFITCCVFLLAHLMIYILLTPLLLPINISLTIVIKSVLISSQKINVLKSTYI
jgi:hypothetical protein